jgi:hypothetical protein
MLTPGELAELKQLAAALTKTLAAIEARYQAEAAGTAKGYPAPHHGTRLA